MEGWERQVLSLVCKATVTFYRGYQKTLGDKNWESSVLNEGKGGGFQIQLRWDSLDAMGNQVGILKLGSSPQMLLRDFPVLGAHCCCIDEFQTIMLSRTKSGSLLRTYIQECNNAWFIFSGSKQHDGENLSRSLQRHQQYRRNHSSCFSVIVDMKKEEKGSEK